MERKLSRTFLSAALMCLGFAADGVSGTVIKLNSELFGRTLSGSATIYLERSRLRIDSNEGGGSVSVIYMGTGEKGPYYWLIDHRDSSYIEIEKDDLIAARKDIEKVMEATRLELQKLPPDERKQAEAMFADRMGYKDFLQPKPEYKEVSRGAKVGRWTCNHFQGFREGERVEEVWAADLKQLGIDSQDLQSLKDMADLFETVGQSLPAFFRFGGDKSKGNKTFPGFAVMMVSYEDGERKEKWEVVDVRHEALDAGLFKLPAGLEKKEAPMGQ